MQSDVIPSRRFRTPYYYTLDRAGVKYLAGLGCDVSAAWRAGRQLHQALFVAHTLELNDVLISALQVGRVSDYQLASFTHERVLKRTPYKTGHVTLIPDAYLEFRHGGRRLPVLLEHDRGTEEQHYFRRRIRGYVAFLRGRAYERLFGTTTMSVVFTTFVSAQRVEQLRAWTRAELKGEPSLLPVFCFAHLKPPLDPQVWLSAIWWSAAERPPERLLAA